MNATELSSAVSDETGLSKTASEGALKAFVSVIAKALAAGEEIRIHGLGTFSVKATAAKAGRNPRTGEAIQIPAGAKAAFKASKSLNDAVKV